MPSYVFDIETNGLINDATTIHSLVLQDVESGNVFSCTDHSTKYQSINKGLQLLSEADCIIGHNIISFDLPVIKKLFPLWRTKALVRDTLVLSRLIWADLKETDFAFRRKNSWYPGKLIGSHSLKAWGYRLRDEKDTFGEETDWAEWSMDMQTYCEQDVHVTDKLWKLIQSKNYSEEAIEIEHEFQKIIYQQEVDGVCFDLPKATALYAQLAGRREEINNALQEIFPPIDKGKWFTPKVNNKKRGYVKGKPVWKSKLIPFNPASRDHIAERLVGKYQWKPEVFTEDGKPKLDDEVLSKLPYLEAPLLSEYLLLQKRLGQIGEGSQAWLKAEKEGIIHGRVTTNGAVTGRCTHHHPNMAQVPAVGAPYGEECRSLFYAPEHYLMLGCDASGLELRCLSHYLTRYDGGAYRDVVLHGDIHTVNQQAAGLATRAEAKRFIYAFLYGAGDVLIGSLLKPEATEKEQRSTGKKVKAKFLAKTPALANLIKDVQRVAKNRGWLKGLDGRVLFVRSQHAALNLLLQSAGAVAMKKATCILWQDLKAAGLKHGDDVKQVLHVHDEYQLYVREGLEEQVGEIAVNAIRKAGEYFHFRCPLDGEYKVGRNWAETH